MGKEKRQMRREKQPWPSDFSFQYQLDDWWIDSLVLIKLCTKSRKNVPNRLVCECPPVSIVADTMSVDNAKHAAQKKYVVVNFYVIVVVQETYYAYWTTCFFPFPAGVSFFYSISNRLCVCVFPFGTISLNIFTLWC